MIAAVFVNKITFYERIGDATHFNFFAPIDGLDVSIFEWIERKIIFWDTYNHEKSYELRNGRCDVALLVAGLYCLARCALAIMPSH